MGDRRIRKDGRVAIHLIPAKCANLLFVLLASLDVFVLFDGFDSLSVTSRSHSNRQRGGEDNRIEPNRRSERRKPNDERGRDQTGDGRGDQAI